MVLMKAVIGEDDVEHKELGEERVEGWILRHERRVNDMRGTRARHHRVLDGLIPSIWSPISRTNATPVRVCPCAMLMMVEGRSQGGSSRRASCRAGRRQGAVNHRRRWHG